MQISTTRTNQNIYRGIEAGLIKFIPLTTVIVIGFELGNGHYINAAIESLGAVTASYLFKNKIKNLMERLNHQWNETQEAQSIGAGLGIVAALLVPGVIHVAKDYFPHR